MLIRYPTAFSKPSFFNLQIISPRYDYPATSLAQIGSALSPVMPSGEVEDLCPRRVAVAGCELRCRLLLFGPKKLKINITHKDPKRTMIPLIYCSSKPTWLSWRPHFFQQRQVPQNVQPDSTGSWHTDLQAPGSQRWGVDPRSQWHRDFIKVWWKMMAHL